MFFGRLQLSNIFPQTRFLDDSGELPEKLSEGSNFPKKILKPVPQHTQIFRVLEDTNFPNNISRALFYHAPSLEFFATHPHHLTSLSAVIPFPLSKRNTEISSGWKVGYVKKPWYADGFGRMRTSEKSTCSCTS